MLITGFIFINPTTENSINITAPPSPNTIDSFMFGAMHTIADAPDNYQDYESLGLGVWHSYTLDDDQSIPGRLVPQGRLADNDKLFTPVSQYSTALVGKINELYNHNQTKLLWERPKIEWLCYGQSSIYQAEPVAASSDLWFYAFNYHDVGTPVSDGQYANGDTVMYCDHITDGIPRNVVWSLRANTEQCKPGPHWSYDGGGEWFIKPKIRIDPIFAENNPNTNVCRIVIKNQVGDIIKSTILKAMNFSDGITPYNGEYLEEYYRLLGSDSLRIQGSWSVNDTGWGFKARGVLYNPNEENSLWIENHADIQVYWYANCDMWIDYVKVENDIAYDLLSNDPLNPNWVQYNSWITDEVNLAMHIPNGASDPAVWKFYIELYEFNNVTCMAYVNHKIDSISGGKIGLMADFTCNTGDHLRWYQHKQFFEPDRLLRTVVQKIGFKHFYAETYPMTGRYGEPPESDPAINFSRIPITLPNHTLGSGIYAIAVAPLIYDEWLQNNLDYSPYILDDGWAPPPSSTLNLDRGDSPAPCPIVSLPQDAGNFRWVMKTGDYMSKHGVPFINMSQAHQWYWPGEVRREPTNEELNMLANVTVTYGAKGLIYFWYDYEQFTPPPCQKIGIGMENEDGSLRDENFYGQTGKDDTIKSIGLRMKKWQPYIMSFDDANRHSYIYMDETERNSCLANSYFADIVTYINGSGTPPCEDDAPPVVPQGLRYECNEDRYLQAATFKKSSGDLFQYFMIVNRRCSPVQTDYNDGRRDVRVAFDYNSSDLPRYNTWKIIDVADNSEVGSFNKLLYNNYVDLGWFMPGEGRLYKMVPVLPTGGTLLADEVISGESFTCEAPVYNNGYNITIGANTTIHFNDSSRFVMSGGVFTVGDQNTLAPQNITSDAVPGGSWRGHSFTNCEVKIYGATFTGLANDTTYAVNIIDCPVVDIRNCTFNTNSSLKGGINVVCFSNPFIAINNIYIGSNTFNSSGSTIPTVNVSSYAGVSTPLIIENNTFSEGNTAVFLNGVIGGAVKGNTITDNYIGINALTSSIDVVQNNISSTVNGSMGLFAAGGSELKLNSSGVITLGGLNNISNEGTGTNNINVDGSYFLLDDGENIFNISSDQSSYHLYGYFPMFTAVTTEETNNCFKVNSSPVDPPINMVTSGYQGSQITFNFIPYLSGCEIIGGGDGLVINLGNGIYDTIYTGGSGSGGSKSSVASVRRTDTKQSSQTHAYDLPTAKTKYDSISVLMRYRNYPQAKTKCLDLINTYPDSIQSLNTVSKLFLATVASDTTYNAANTLKIFYENLILNHQSNTSLVKRANYYILKCKVRMREYSQALAGFQQIINLNPYSYEGLIARWDYMATSLLIQGQGGGERGISDLGLGNADLKEEELNQYLDDNPQSENRNPNSTGDKSPFTKEQRQDIRKSINTAIDVSKNNDETKMKTLEEKSELGDVNASKELSQMKSLKQVVKTEKPKSITQHIKIVSEDIRKVFGSNTSSKGNQPKNLPTVFRISQNYPNPFNPVTKINYDLPKDSKVNIVIYDILGREVKRLVNNELKTAGTYLVDFNAMNYASGVYFYRIEAEDPNGNKFVDSKKMVLIK